MTYVRILPYCPKARAPGSDGGWPRVSAVTYAQGRGCRWPGGSLGLVFLQYCNSCAILHAMQYCRAAVLAIFPLPYFAFAGYKIAAAFLWIDPVWRNIARCFRDIAKYVLTYFTGRAILQGSLHSCAGHISSCHILPLPDTKLPLLSHGSTLFGEILQDVSEILQPGS